MNTRTEKKYWEVHNRGYIFDIERARVFTESQVEDKLSVQMGNKIAWPKKYIDGRSEAGYVSIADCDIKEAWKPE